ncbi:MAG: SpvB/TcaC N-terminal domain-containing protein [Bacteroidota bacterium]|nr:SpvB/TcaC N-terminal domain-containing protein [Bacteroidota bacterium]
MKRVNYLNFNLSWQTVRLLFLLLIVLTGKNVLSQTNYSPLYTSTNFVKTIDLSRPVGTVDGTAGTTATGGVTYTIPIYAPPGTNGMQPSVSIVYNSQGSSGVVGFGWNIAGLSMISRTGKNIYHNGQVKPVSYTAEDAFLLDGMRLNAITGSNGANGTVYAGEAESFTKIISITTGSVNNPDWFLVTAKDGSTMEFGNTADSRILTDDGLNVMLWRLNRIIDINGNYIDFKYNNNSRDSRIDEINYTGNITTGLLPYNKLKFTYGNRNEVNTGYDGGASLSS